MKSETVDLAKLVELLEGLRQDVAKLADRVATLEADAGATPVPVPSASAHAVEGSTSPPPVDEGFDEELVLVISAAIAAFLGKKPHIRQIRLIGTGAWAQQGRVTIQASHAFSVGSTRSLN